MVMRLNHGDLKGESSPPTAQLGFSQKFPRTDVPKDVKFSIVLYVSDRSKNFSDKNYTIHKLS